MSTLFAHGQNVDSAHTAHDAALAAGRVPVRTELPGLAPAWVIIGDEQARAALVDPRLGKDTTLVTATIRAQATAAGYPTPTWLSRMFNGLLFLDGPQHSEERRVLAGAFTARRVRELRPRIKDITARLLDNLHQAEESVVDLVQHVAGAVPLTVICELLGIPEPWRARFRELTLALMQDDPAINLPASDELGAFLVELVAGKRADADRGHQGADLTSALLDLDTERLVDILVLVFVAGHETTVNLIGNTMLALLRHPPLWRDAAQRPDLVAEMVEETLRWDAPVRTATHRVTLEPVVYGGVEIPAGELVMVSLEAANRDPDQWEDPTAFDPARHPRGHLAFGLGPHACLGASLGRAEAQIVMRQITARFPDATLAEPVMRLRRTVSSIMNGLTALPVALRPA
ncbi:cytochrome P450 [Umezawaea sp. Da 62-37]|uniref:cytochrome P450 n=1 Tax=Umezawaea sp. Da 62-37 TaxID=3075927 RepID=UPI0028F6C802|nr:cytochrome P450 [Umezawaea sp. Da 62-37]WNV83061.1 cytochrome P450 [Umezawaea sp. Da 62-37]